MKDDNKDIKITSKIISNSICVVTKYSIKYIISKQIKNLFVNKELNIIANNTQYRLKHGFKIFLALL